MSFNPLMLLRDRLTSRSFVTFFAIVTSLYLFDVFIEGYAKSTSPELQQKISGVFGSGVLVGIYLGSILEGLVASVFFSFILTKIRHKKAARKQLSEL